MTKNNIIVLRDLQLKDIESFYHLTHPSKEHHKYNGPYFKQNTLEEHKKYIKELEERLKAGETNVFGSRKIVADKATDELIGQVNWYWKSKETLWMEIGIIIFNENYWGKGLGYEALKLWTTRLFDTRKDIVRLGLTTWSGNKGMMKLAEKLQFKQEAVYRKARIVNDVYYDSVSYGILREEWDDLNPNT